MCQRKYCAVLQALKEKQTLEQQLRLDRRERLNRQQAAKLMHEKAQAELNNSQAEIERRNADVESDVSQSPLLILHLSA